MDINEEVSRLSQIPMLSKVETCKLKLLAFTSKLMEYQDGEILFKEGDPADCAYLIMSGQVEIYVGNSEEAEVIVTRGENDLIGEMAIISKQTRSASVRAKGKVTVLRIDDDVFLQLLSSDSEVALDVMKQLSNKLTEAHEQLQQALNSPIRH